MSWRSECQTEQYLSLDSWMARSTAWAGTLPVNTKCSVKLTKCRGGSSRR